MIIIYVVIFGFLLDLCLGDPNFILHPVVIMGKIISFLEKFLRKFLKNKNGELFGGFILVIILVSLSFFVPFLILSFLQKINFYLYFIVESFMCYQIFATKCLKDESMKVYKELEKNDIEKARKAVSMIVGRDTNSLDKVGVTKAAIETIAENTSDGVIAPMIFMIVGGAPLGFLYKAINTMDSMIGYKNDKYLYFGRVAAKLDDIANFIPSRFSAIMMIISSFFCKFDFKNAWYIFKRDRFNQHSPNSAQTESVCAGALQIQLGGDAYYFGKLVHKKTIGDFKRSVENQDIIKANKLLYVTAILSLIICILIRYIFIFYK